MRILILILIILASSTFAAEDKHPFKPDPDMPAYTLPDVLTTRDGKKITTADEWKNIRRLELIELFRNYEYGRVPAKPVKTTFKVASTDPNAMDGAATLKLIEVNVASGEKSITIHVSLFIPNKVPKPVPTFMLICNRPAAQNIDPTRKVKSPFWPAEEVIARGYGVSAFHYADVVLDKDNAFDQGAFGMLDDTPRKPDAWGAIAAWAWGGSRVMDYFETDSDVAKDKVVVIGHSRGGKTALWCGAQDERFAAAVSSCSGCSGASLSRRRFDKKETVDKINKSFPFWFCDNYKAFNTRIDELPFDQHMLLALMAPRPVLIGSAEEDTWADPRGEYLSTKLTGPVYELFGKRGIGDAPMPRVNDAIHGDAAHYHIREGKHNLLTVDWNSYMDFMDKYWGRGK